MMTFEAVAEVGETVKCYDFEPMAGREERYVIGQVVEKGFLPEAGFRGFRVRVEADTVWPEDPREEVLVPFQVLMLDYPGRVQKFPKFS